MAAHTAFLLPARLPQPSVRKLKTMNLPRSRSQFFHTLVFEPDALIHADRFAALCCAVPKAILKNAFCTGNAVSWDMFPRNNLPECMAVQDNRAEAALR